MWNLKSQESREVSYAIAKLLRGEWRELKALVEKVTIFYDPEWSLSINQLAMTSEMQMAFYETCKVMSDRIKSVSFLAPEGSRDEFIKALAEGVKQSLLTMERQLKAIAEKEQEKREIIESRYDWTEEIKESLESVNLFVAEGLWEYLLVEVEELKKFCEYQVERKDKSQPLDEKLVLEIARYNEHRAERNMYPDGSVPSRNFV